ncbi:ABC transporter substrate-binding protein [Paraburkholderia aspalathi]|jgi:iron(III) transport system substrate-binding protein|uniref:Iron(III) transport system substrate-binding protein n=1 Tax=Paraburkholderia aspalathi TaxID=1324617 RepID=A0ABM8SJR6_9BURK|nr:MULTISPECIES: ABC transporter substrate-binding protein [Paraburkholderia]MBK3821936.1 ABC transporter substrate-binding protein [Paraburkholderia aspalathi]MBK3833770.1 ABC transporter substrate-binding protein [Paraburkholderia aspalathi]MBK3863455.1 ABC transporter substrate-binding protein [Paraburkholderia aspalathi]MCX4137182.1 ABC transporter substrate-binding protein [Paraburkholderia aspalathi]MCX4153048.1 ABC transporter substrate-binding protein [Paraburkholderia aspalathi]
MYKLLSSIVCSLSLAFGPITSVQALTVYTAGPGNLSKKLVQGFERKTGVKVDLFQATTGKVMARIEAESSNPHADVLISASWDTAQDLERRGWLAPYTSPNAAHVPPMFKAPSYVAQGISALGIVWNTRAGKPEPHDWRDLAAPEYRNQVTTPNPALSGASLDLLLGLQDRLGEAAWTLFDSLHKNGMLVLGPNAQAINPVLQGAKSAVFGAVDYVAYGAAASGESVKVIFPSSGTVIAPRPMMILKSSHAQADARAFVDYVLSDEGQQLVAAAYLIPAREDIDSPRPRLKDLKLLPQDDGSNTKSRAEVLSRFNALFGEH